MTYTTIDLLDSGATTRKAGVDRLSTIDGSAAPTNADAQLTKVGWGAEGDFKSSKPGQGMPVVEDKFQSVLQRSSGLTSSSSSQTGLASNSSRRKVYVSNGSASGIWLDFGQAAVAGNGVYLPSKAKDTYETDMEVRFIMESGGTTGPVSFMGV